MGRNLDPRFTRGHSVLVTPVKRVCVTSYVDKSVTVGEGKEHKWNISETLLALQATGVSFTLLVSGASLRRTCRHTLPERSHTFDPTPDIPPHAEQTGATSRWYRAVPLRSGQAASSYNNIALWRSPERTGKCCLCAASGWGTGVAGGWGGLFVQPQQQPSDGVGRAEAEKRAGQGFKGAVLHLPLSPLGLTWCESLLGGIVKCYRSHHKLPYMQFSLQRITDVSHEQQRWVNWSWTGHRAVL